MVVCFKIKFENSVAIGIFKTRIRISNINKLKKKKFGDEN